jgi:hypothetical protein
MNKVPLLSNWVTRLMNYVRHLNNYVSLLMNYVTLLIAFLRVFSLRMTRTGKKCRLADAGVGMARCAVRAAFSGATGARAGRVALASSFRPLDAGGDIAARCPYRARNAATSSPRLLTPHREAA